jgi:glycosyltransferase involved in cell wall biosynthesis
MKDLGQPLGHEPLDRQRAVAYFKRLEGENLVGVSQSEQCEMAIVVPASDERPQNIIKLLESLLAQQEVSPEQFEVILVVNNATDDGTAAFKELFANNQAVLNLPLWANRPEVDLSGLPNDERAHIEHIRNCFRFFIVDKSSPGSEMENANVGKARNRGVAEAGLRFFERGKNGILFQTDADTRLADTQFLSHMKEVFRDPRTIGGSGGGYYEFDISTEDPAERRRLEKDRADLVMLKIVKRMYQYDLVREAGCGFPGFNMMSRSFETAVMGGLEDRASGEDTRFGKAMVEFSHQRGKRLFASLDLRVATSLRESGRTHVLYKTFAAGVTGGQKLIENPFGRKLGKFLVAHPELQCVGYAAAKAAYLAENPPIPLEDAYEGLRAKVAETAHGQAFLARMDQRSFDSFPWLTENKHR